MPKAASSKTKSRTHKLGGCLTCRRRHVKCDHVKPICGICAATGLNCDGYQNALQWAADGTAGKDENNTRNYLYSENERRQMTRALSSDLVNGCVDTSLERLDNSTDRVTAETLSVGPFGVFNTENPPSVTIKVHPPTTHHPVETQHAADAPAANSAWDAPLDFDFNFNVGNHLDWADLFNYGLDVANSDLTFDHIGDPPSDDLGWPMSPAHRGYASTLHERTPTPRAILDNAEPSSVQWTEREVLGHAPILLRNYMTNIVPHFSALPVEYKSPWELLNLNSAIKTLADLTYMQSASVTHASRANLYALLAHSAHHMYMTEDTASPASPGRMNALVEHCGRMAKKNMQLTLKLETRAPGQAKYKDQLMAIFGMIVYATAVGNQNDARCYVVDSEKLLRIRGLDKQEMSRRTRLLHHVYSWIRINGESTYVLHDLSNASLIDKINAIITADSPSSSSSRPQHAELDDFLRIPADATSDDADPLSQKTHHIGLRDIHLQDPRPWAQGLFMRICGIPETWLSLLSQTTRFANVQELLARHAPRTPPAVAARIAAKVDRLEGMVCAFAAAETGAPMLAALSSALLVFFYRRVRNLHPLVLQPHVAAVVAELRAVEAQGPPPCTPWPAFVAGCEADRADQREVLARWVERSARQSGVRAYADALEVMREVWRRRDAGAMVVTWVDVARERGGWPMLY